MTVAPSNVNKPYKGPRSFQTSDAALFFAREAAAKELTSLVLSHRFSLVHAQSGAGKTSLLNARLIPALEARGWTPVRILACDDPVASTRDAVLDCVAPPPAAEAQALRRAWEALFAGRGDVRLGELLRAYDKLPVRHAQKRDLIAPVAVPPPRSGQAEVEPVKVIPFVARLLRSSIDLCTFEEQVNAVLLGDQFPGPSLPEVSEQTPVGDLIDLLESGSSATAHRRLLMALDSPAAWLHRFLDNLLRIYGCRRSNFRLVLIFDQFEELFTRFVDPGVVGHRPALHLPDWRLRWEFFDQLQALHTEPPEAEHAGKAAPAAAAHLPLRVVISLRSEYIAQLEPLRMFAHDLDKSAFHLRFLSADEGRLAIRSPAETYGYTYADDCFEEIVHDLVKEERFIEPTHLQIVCERLWEVRGHELSVSEGNDALDVETYDRLGRAAGIMSDFFHGYLETLGQDERIETLELLEPLITSSGTRNIVERERLLRTLLINGGRERLLLSLVDRSIVRVQTRLGGQFVEITHEFLIPAIREALNAHLYADKKYAQLRNALHALERQGGSWSPGGVDARLLEHDFHTLHENRHRLQWEPCAVELMFREAIRLGVDDEVLRVWTDLYARSEEAAAA